MARSAFTLVFALVAGIGLAGCRSETAGTAGQAGEAPAGAREAPPASGPAGPQAAVDERGQAGSGEGQDGEAGGETALPLPTQRWTGDLDGMIERRLIRVLVVYSKTMYFVDKGTQRGSSYDAVRKLEEDLNLRLKTGKLKLHVAFLPVSRDELLPALLEGRGDIAVASLTVTEARKKLVDFTEPTVRDVSEIVVTGPRSPKIATLDDLSGKQVFVRPSSSYHESVLALNQRFAREGKAPVTIKPAPDQLADEDLLEMLSAGLVPLVVVDRHVADFWQQVLPDLTPHPEVALRSGGSLAWAIRPGSPRLKAELDRFIAAHRQGTAFGNEIIRRYYKSTTFLKRAGDEAELKKFRELVGLFRKYAGQYGLDWLLIAAQGYQESRLDHSVRSPVGAIGVMQVMPKTGQELKVGDIHQLEPNIHAGVKYIRFMIDRYFAGEPMSDLDKGLFAFAAYNAGPGRIRQLRGLARERGLDPNVWFNNVEVIAAEKIGRETVTYVSNIYKYYIAYRLAMEESDERSRARQAVGGQTR